MQAVGTQIKNLEALRDQGNKDITDDDYETIMWCVGVCMSLLTTATQNLIPPRLSPPG
jgi:hypothetical protein